MPRNRSVEIDGHVYSTAVEAWLAEAVPGITYEAFMMRLYNGWEAWRAARVAPQSNSLHARKSNASVPRPKG